MMMKLSVCVPISVNCRSQKVANGTLTVTEMLRELTNESLARQSKAMHEIQRLMGIYQLKYTTMINITSSDMERITKIGMYGWH